MVSSGGRGEITGAQLRQRLRALPPALSGRRRCFAAAMIVSGLAVLLTGTVLAESAPIYRLQGADLAGEFVTRPYWLTPGTIAGRHYRLQAGLLGFADGGGVAASGYCIDARTHRRHDAVYSVGPPLDGGVVANARQVRWLLAHAYPNGPPPLGTDPRGLARSGSVVQAAIWHFSDAFDLDPAGTPQVDLAFRRAYEALIQQASAADPDQEPAAAISLASPAGAGLAGHPVPVTATVTLAGGLPAPDRTAVTIVSDAGHLGADTLSWSTGDVGGAVSQRTRDGKATVWVEAKAGVVNLRAAASLPVAPGRVLVSSVPTQRLVETTWGRQAVQAVAQVRFAAPPPLGSPTVVVTPPVVIAPTVVAAPSAAPSPAPRIPTTATVAIARPLPPAPGEAIVSMPSTGRPVTGPLGRAVGCGLVGLGLLASTPARSRRRTGVRC